MITQRVEGNRIVISFNLKEYILKTLQIPLKYITYRVEGDFIVVEAEIDSEKLTQQIAVG